MICLLKYYSIIIFLFLPSCVKNTQNIQMDSGAIETFGSEVKHINNGIFIPDGKGDFIWSPGTNLQKPNEAVIQAQELRLKVKELAAQLLETRNNDALVGLVALPTSFVNVNNFSESSSLGRYMSEAMIYEFNQRGFPIKEYRMDKKIHIDDEAKGEFALKRRLPPLSVNQKWAAILIGTYLKENNTIFINVRLVRAGDGIILRTAQTVLSVNSLINQMTKEPILPPKPPLSSGTIRINTQKNDSSSLNYTQEKTITPQKPIVAQPLPLYKKPQETHTAPKPGFAKNL